MTPLDVLARAAEIALRHGPEAVRLWTAIEQSLVGEHPELREPPRAGSRDAIDARIDAELEERARAEGEP